MNLATYAYRQSSILPPRGLLLSLLSQAPLIISNWPLKPSMFEVVGGLVIIAAGIALNIWSASLFERNAVVICPFSSTPVLVTCGPFVVSRHPMYLGLVAIALGLSLATGVLANVWSAVTLAIWLHYAYVLPEERFLRDRFRTAYDEYSKRVPRWVLVGK
jgi:protein-S-isoprenylcysteine O-methyltransferase Ste14